MIDSMSEVYAVAIARRLRAEGFAAEAAGSGVMVYPDPSPLDRDTVFAVIPRIEPVVRTVTGQGAVFLQMR